jgi:CO dehydrogenase maturation factor
MAARPGRRRTAGLPHRLGLGAAAERGAVAPFAELEADNRAVLADVRAALDNRERDWAAYHRTTVAMHRANATAWAGVDRIAQIDPDFVPA